ncbi:MAG: hypothetical protein OEQ18_12795 [Gammaproteobacteria bacterium]|nr:hypothetical protein [Gammaproteobacteria bacterium]
MRDSILKKFHGLKSHPNRAFRVTVGVLLVLGGLLGALPILGFWMLPLGLILLSVDFYWAKRAHINLRILWRRTRSLWKRPIVGRED